MDFEGKSIIVAAFDLDQTLVKPKSGNKYPKDAYDWAFTYHTVPAKLKEVATATDRAVVILSNQGLTGIQSLLSKKKAV